MGEPKPVIWVADSRAALKGFPREVQRAIGRAVAFAQRGEKAPGARPLKDFGGAGVLEIVANEEGSTYRGVSTVRFRGLVYVLHVFQKKSHRGISTPKHEIDLIRRRLVAAQADYARRRQQERTEERHA